MRPTMSLAAPAANGTIAWMVRSGQPVPCALAGSVMAMSAAPRKPMVTPIVAPVARMNGISILPGSDGGAGSRCPAWRMIRTPSIGAPTQGAQSARCVTFPTGQPALDIAAARCHDARNEFHASLLHVVERLDLRHAGLDQALWRVRRRGRVRQPLLPNAWRQDRSQPRLRASLGDLQRRGRGFDGSAVMARLAPPHRRCSSDAGQGRAAPVVEAASRQPHRHARRAPADRLDAGARAPPQGDRRLQGLDAGSLTFGRSPGFPKKPLDMRALRRWNDPPAGPVALSPPYSPC